MRFSPPLDPCGGVTTIETGLIGIRPTRAGHFQVGSHKWPFGGVAQFW